MEHFELAIALQPHVGVRGFLWISVCGCAGAGMVVVVCAC